MREIELPDGTIVEFPDEMDDAAIASVLSKQFRAAPTIDRESFLARERAAADPASGMSGPGKFFAGMGKSVYDTGRGVKQLFGGSSQAEIDDTARMDASLMDTGAGMAGNIGGQAAQMAIPGGAIVKGARVAGLARSAPYVAATAGGGGYSATQPVLSGQSRAGNAAFGAAAGLGGQAVGAGLGRVAKGASDRIDPATRALFEKAKAAGIPVTAAQLSDSRFVRGLASVVDRLPWSGAAKRQAGQQGAFNAAVGRQFGAEGPLLDKTARDAAKGKIGKTLDRLGSAYGVKMDDELVSRLASITDEAARYSPDDAGRAVKNVVDDILSKSEEGRLPGQAYQTFITKLRLMGKAKDRYGGYVGEVKRAMEDALGRSLPAAEAELNKATLRQYANLKAVEKIAMNNNGNIPPAQLTRAAKGYGELAELGEIGQRFLKQTVPDSGTPERMLIGGALGGTAGGGLAAGAIEPMTAAALVGSGKVIGTVLNSRAAANYMASGIPGARTVVPKVGAALPYATVPAVEQRRKRRRVRALLDD